MTKLNAKDEIFSLQRFYWGEELREKLIGFFSVPLQEKKRQAKFEKKNCNNIHKWQKR